MSGRWPPNLLLSHSVFCGEACHVSCPVRALDEQTGHLHRPGNYTRQTDVKGRIYGEGIGRQGAGTFKPDYGDTGGASRFFPVFRWTEEDLW